MKTRVISALVMLPLLIFIFLGGYFLLGICFVIGVMGVYELFGAFKKGGVNPSFPIAMGSAVLLYGLNIFTDGGSEYFMFWLFVTVLACLLYLFNFEKREIADAMATITGVFYVILFSFHMVLVDQCAEHRELIWLTVVTAFGTDTLAYFAGSAFGKHKLAPAISPKKTIEGSVGGVLGSMLLSAIFGYFVVPELLPHCIAIGFLGGIVSQLGDLTASVFKRKMGIKDYGNLIPGHGGILDRFDSILFTAPMVYYYIRIVLM